MRQMQAYIRLGLILARSINVTAQGQVDTGECKNASDY